MKMTNILEEGLEYVESVIGGAGKAIEPAVEVAEAKEVTAAKDAWASIETSFNADLPALEGQGLALLTALLTGGEAAALALLPLDASVDMVTAKTALTNAVVAAKDSLLPAPIPTV